MSKVFEINAETGESIERDLTTAEKAEAAKVSKEFAEAKASHEAKESQRIAILDRLGLTAEEAALLLK
jgi:hypothetical protein